MQKRRFLQAGVGAGAAALSLPSLAQTGSPNVRWRLASSFPKSLDTIYGGAEVLSKRLAAITGGKFQVSVHAAGELMPAFGVVDALQSGSVECSHTASYYFVGKNKAFGFETTLPFGLNQRQQNAWLYYGGGQQLVRDFLKDFNIISFPGGNTGVQMGGWFKKEIRKTADLKGLKMRIPGIGGEVMARLGAVPQNIPGGDIYPALEKGTIDAAEWVGPYDDEKLGFYKIAPHYYYPGWWESNSSYSFYVNTKAWEALPADYKAAFEAAAAEANIDMMAEYDFKNPTALRKLVANGVKLHAYPQDLLKAAQDAAFDLYAEESDKNPAFRKLYESWGKFRGEVMLWHRFAEHTYSTFVYNNPPKRSGKA
ncbi:MULTISPECIES: TRAP transporter substrate-binding protein [Ramlibacter]|uniref:ABC transporter substrate-binding protein n=1 Tax=Ramlibacter pinisoli TaxID=2682844 RepID=A0A6N8IRT5_9BURK|nr:MULTISPECIES: TRAP transporter substrate-binding protein [Ramlibacter]MBA2964592.1 TRAP transporter substrate-binding protein [Ramlibacter sp. CGMCC 1.13660]MVQ29557.1 ABC transporter substrate-binding protein [Ramlibacter pinisoli]